MVCHCGFLPLHDSLTCFFDSEIPIQCVSHTHMSNNWIFACAKRCFETGWKFTCFDQSWPKLAGPMIPKDWVLNCFISLFVEMYTLKNISVLWKVL